jgi:hypothetical protein
MITRYPWFGPKRGLGWGWTPVTWEGWALTAVSCAVIIGAYFVFGRAPMTTYVTLGAVAVFIVIVILTGTAPG